MLEATIDGITYNLVKRTVSNPITRNILPDGGIEYRKDGVPHQEEDMPARIYPDGRVEYYQEGVLHRNHGPALIEAGGKKHWYNNGVEFTVPYHTEVLGHGIKKYYIDSKLTKIEYPGRYFGDGKEITLYKFGDKFVEDEVIDIDESVIDRINKIIENFNVQSKEQRIEKIFEIFSVLLWPCGISVLKKHHRFRKCVANKIIEFKISMPYHQLREFCKITDLLMDKCPELRDVCEKSKKSDNNE